MTTKPYTREEAQSALDRVVAICVHSLDASQAVTSLRETLGNTELSSGEKICLEGFIEFLEGKGSRDPDEYFYDKLLIAPDVADRNPGLLDPEVVDRSFMRAVHYFRARGY